MSGIKEVQVQAFWVLSRQWRGDQRFGAINTGEMLKSLADLGGSTNNTGWQRLENQVAALLSQVINNKRNRKRKPINNVVNLNERRAFHAQALLQEIRRVPNPQDLVGKQLLIKIKVG